MTEPRHYGMHRHFTAAGSILMFGGGIKKGFVYGKTAEERPCTTIENPVVMEDLHATIYHALGIAPDTSYVVERRPVYVTRDGVGKADHGACSRTTHDLSTHNDSITKNAKSRRPRRPVMFCSFVILASFVIIVMVRGAFRGALRSV